MFVDDQDWTGFMIYGSGFASNSSTTITIKEESEPKDYQIITDWIDKM